MPNLGGWELVIIVGVLVLLFGAKRLPDMARSIGQSARVFKGEMKGMRSDEERTEPGREATPPAAPTEPQALPPTGSASTVAAETPQATRSGHTKPGQ